MTEKLSLTEETLSLRDKEVADQKSGNESNLTKLLEENAELQEKYKKSEEEREVEVKIAEGANTQVKQIQSRLDEAQKQMQDMVNQTNDEKDNSH